MSSAENISSRFLRTAVVIVVIGMALGLYMALAEDHRLMPVHAHINVIGWLSFFAIGLYYRLFPHAAEGALPNVQYWLLLIGIVLMAISLGFLMTGGAMIWGPIAGLAGLLLIIGMILFAITIFRTAQSAPA
jgi:uncharacterized membrane protein YgdD (TMEM256/DUF423 family)